MIFSSEERQQAPQDEELMLRQRRILDSISSKFSQEYDEFIAGMQHGKERQEQQQDKREEQKAKKRVERLLRPYYLPPSGISYYRGFTVYSPAGTTIQRVSQAALGPSVLGRAFPGLGVIQILDTLYGQEFQEVMKHEVNHILYPFLTEHQIRQKTRQELPFYASFH